MTRTLRVAVMSTGSRAGRPGDVCGHVGDDQTSPAVHDGSRGVITKNDSERGTEALTKAPDDGSPVT